MTRFLFIKVILFFSLLFISNSCGKPINRPDVGTDLASPTAVASDDSGKFFYVLNTDHRHKYNTGSILILDDNGNKIAAQATPRLGQSMVVQGDTMIVAYDRESDKDAKAQIIVYDLSKGASNLQEVFKQELDCSPANITARKNYKYFALSCMEGDLYIGELAGSTKVTQFKKVRSYPQFPRGARRAMYINTKRDLLFQFMTDIHDGKLVDTVYDDKETWVAGKKVEDKPDEIPDISQQTDSKARDILNNTTRFHFMVYDLAAEAATGFKDREFKEVRATEPRWLYWKADNQGHPDDAAVGGNPNMKYYRTNIRDAKPDPEDPDVFYISHAGVGKFDQSEHANDIMKVTIIGDPRPDSSNKLKKLDEYLKFDRVYGFKGDQTGKDKYFNSFLITKISGRKVLLANSYRDLANFGNQRYTLSGLEMTEDPHDATWFAQATSNDSGNSYYDLALAKNGNLLTVSFFDESLRLFNVKFGENVISEIKSIK